MGKLTYFRLGVGVWFALAGGLSGCSHKPAINAELGVLDAALVLPAATNRQLAGDPILIAYNNYFPTTFSYVEKMERLLQLSHLSLQQLPSLGHPKRAILHKFAGDLADELKTIRNANKNKAIQSRSWMAEISHPQKQALILSMSRIAASADTMLALFTYLNHSPFINSDTNSQANYFNLLAMALGNLKYDFQNAVALSLAPEQMQYQLKIAQGDYAAALSQGVRFRLAQFFPEPNQQPLRRDFNETLSKIEQIARSNDNKNLDQLNKNMHALAQSPNWNNLRNAFKTLGLLGSGDIEGSQADYENLAAVKFGFEMIDLLYQNQ